jgi:hypothetical protein
MIRKAGTDEKTRDTNLIWKPGNQEETESGKQERDF